MRFLMIATGYLPYMFSENLCNGKLVYALNEAGIQVDVISKVDEGPTYQKQWTEPWLSLKHSSRTIHYSVGNKFSQGLDYLYSAIKMDWHFANGIRWARRAYEEAQRMITNNTYDAILTRSPGDIVHLVGYKLKKKISIRWIANWNDPAAPIWPEPYTHHFSPKQQHRHEVFSLEMLKSADITTFPSDSLRQHFIHHFPILNQRSTLVIPHIGLSESIFRQKDATKRDKLYMCHSGNLSSERNPELMFKAMRHLIDEGTTAFQLHIMGRTNPLVDSLIAEYQLEGYVKYIGSFAYLDAIDKMQEYDILVLLEAVLKKGIFFASKFTDYAQTGRPIWAISPANGFAHDMIIKHHAGIFSDNSNVSSIEYGLKSLIDLWQNKKLSSISSLRLFQEFSPNKVVEQYKSICL